MASRSVVESEDSTLDSVSSSRRTARSATSRSSRTAKTSSSPGWRTESLTKLPSGEILEPLGPLTGEEKLIWFMGDIHASRSARQVSATGLWTRVTSGQISPESSASAPPSGAFSRTSPAIYNSDFAKSPQTWKRWVTALRQDSLRQLKSGRPTGGSDSSSWPTKLAKQWPTATTTDCKASGAAGYSTASGRHSGTTLVDAAVRQPTWATSTTRDWKARANPSAEVPTRGLLGRQAPRSGIGGGESRMRLNPLFVTWLMGLPIGWLSFEPLAMRVFQQWRRAHSSIWLEN